MFADRQTAGAALAEEVRSHLETDPVFGGPDAPCTVVALPRGGVPIAAIVAREIGAPLDLVMVRKIGVPWHPELAAAAVVNGDAPVVVRNEEVIRECRVTEEELSQARDRELAEIERRRALYIGSRARAPLKDRVVIVIDDGVATGATALAALRALRKFGPRALVLATPVAPPDLGRELRGAADRIIALQQPSPFYAIGAHYGRFDQVSDEEVQSLLADAAGGG